MKIILHKRFEKKFSKLRVSEKNSFKERRNLFLEDPYNPILNNHALNPTGKHVFLRSINITGDLRLIFKIIDSENNIYQFLDIDTHSNLY